MNRPDTDIYMMALAMMARTRSTCQRRSVGCVLTDASNNVLSTGYNGAPKGLEHCSADLCPGLRAPSGTQLDGCRALHAEQNALLRCGDVSKITTCYVTAKPCLTCTKLLLNTGCHMIIYVEPYSHDMATTMWAEAGRVSYRMSDRQILELKELFRMMSERSDSALTMSRRG